MTPARIILALAVLQGCAQAPPSSPRQPEPAPKKEGLPAPEPESPPAPILERGEIDARILEDPSRLEILFTRPSGRERLVHLPFDLDDESADRAELDRFDVKGSDGRVVFVQLFFEGGEDLFWREIIAFAIDADAGVVLWEGRGEYSNSFGYCESVDVPEPRVEDDVLVIDRFTGVFEDANVEPLGDPCSPVEQQRTVDARVVLPGRE